MAELKDCEAADGVEEIEPRGKITAACKKFNETNLPKYEAEQRNSPGGKGRPFGNGRGINGCLGRIDKISETCMYEKAIQLS